MAIEAAIEVRDVSKRYLLGEDRPGGSAKEAIVRSVRKIWARPVAPWGREEIWSLKNVSFDLIEGRALGIIGRNGAGKSTLLKILTRITEPTSGMSRTRGRVASLLEVGTGFHPELTGRENIFLNGAILGMTQRDIAGRFDEIVEFAGTGRFLDTPIKRYSSGMQLRLAFAVAAHLEPDILVVDEILAVGDLEFQRKCLRRMADVEREGRTVVFVSHDLEAIARLCQEGIWLEKGEVKERGSIGSTIDAYIGSTRAAGADESIGVSHGPVTLRSVRVADHAGAPADSIRRDREFSISIEYAVTSKVTGLDVAVYVVNEAGMRVFDEALSDTVSDRPEGPGTYVARVSVPPVLNVGEYRIGVWMGSAYETLIHEPATQIFRLEGSLKGRPERAVELLLPWEIIAVGKATISPESDPR